MKKQPSPQEIRDRDERDRAIFEKNRASLEAEALDVLTYQAEVSYSERPRTEPSDSDRTRPR